MVWATLILVVGLQGSAWSLDAQSLGALFDGSARAPAADFLLRRYPDEPRAAPRYILNLEALPEEGRFLLPGVSELPHKNQEEAEEFTEEVNAVIRLRNRGRLLDRQPEWTYDPRPAMPTYSCLSYGASKANDWWALQLGRGLPLYRSSVHGGLERGLNPRLLELKYKERAALPDYRSTYEQGPTMFQRDPVRRTAVPYHPRGYAELLIEDEAYEVADPATGVEYRWEPEMSAMEGQVVELFSTPIGRRTAEREARRLAEGLEKWGTAYVQLSDPDHPKIAGAHTVVVVGYFCAEDGERVVPCSGNASDADWARTAYFIIHDSEGAWPADRPIDGRGSPGYKAARIESVDKAYFFPHGLDVTAEPAAWGEWLIRVTNKGGRPVKVRGLRVIRGDDDVPLPVTQTVDGFIVRGNSDAALIEVDAPYYFEADGRPRRYALRLRSESASAVEARRTAPTPSYRERMRGFEPRPQP